MRRAVREVLAGERSYDSLAPEDQAAVRAEWQRLLDAIADGVDLSDSFDAAGIKEWVDISPDGTLVHRRRLDGPDRQRR